MKVWEKLAEIIGDRINKKRLRSWFIFNRFTPDMVVDLLNITGKDADTLTIIANKTEKEDEYAWIDAFLDCDF